MIDPVFGVRWYIKNANDFRRLSTVVLGHGPKYVSKIVHNTSRKLTKVRNEDCSQYFSEAYQCTSRRLSTLYLGDFPIKKINK